MPLAPPVMTATLFEKSMNPPEEMLRRSIL